MYADAAYVEWEKKGAYWAADFWHNNREMEAWFTMDGQWYQTESDLAFSELPEMVRTAFQSGDFKDWRVDDVDMFEHRDNGTFYVLDIERGNQDYHLLYSPDGALMQAVEDR
jgi:hypothetical protein